ncbi:MAG: radical SAM protein [Candidatus Omnitrophota bacterium]
MKKILLLNPPSITFNYSRDYFCSKTLKTDYVEHPIDLLILSGILGDKFSVDVLDATALNLNFHDCFDKIKDVSPDIIIFLSGSASWIDDFNFMKQVKEANPVLKVIGIGDIFFNRDIIINHKWIDAVLLDFTSRDIVNYLEGHYDGVKNMFFRNHEDIVFAGITQYHNEEFEIPIPRHELFLRGKYTFPFARKLPFTTILTDYGCGSRCLFCLYNTLGFKSRKLENVFEELEYIHSLGIRELFIKDQSFGHDRARALQFSREILKRGWRFSWTAFSRMDAIDLELASNMKEAGCHTLILGVETANEDLLKKFKPGLTLEKMDNALKLCKKLKIRTVGTFCLGLPSETKESVLKTIDYAVKSGCDFASFNVFVPKTGTVLEREFLQHNGGKKLVDREWDQSGMSSISGNGIISEEEMADLLSFAVRKFYFRISYVFNRVLNLTSVTDLRMFMRSGMGLFSSMIKKSSRTPE